ncbi:MAG TPA: L,D-transpeptidase family protein, partial [Cyclobacteriaceae bacterium]|nr:L,D-transpeptidase family protein [Cyclobacteriaceae bacterium]
SLWNVMSHAISKNHLGRGLEMLEPQNKFYHLLKNDLKTKLDSLPLVLTDSVSSAKLRQRIRHLCINMEQWRWEQMDFNRPYVLVNIPSFQLDVIDNDSLVFESNVVVGTPVSQTPTLDSKLVNMILYPYWNVPRDIATKELLPKIKSDSTYLLSNRYRVLDIQGREIHPDSIDWKAHHVNNFPFMIQQSEGEHNALGIVKFNFINDFNIYLHDTNAKRFFGYDKRAYSHGCIRVERALDLARFLVSRENPYASVNDYQRFLKAGKQQQVNIDPIELRIRYFTCHAGKDGVVRFFDDIYQKNASLMEALFCRENIDTCPDVNQTTALKSLVVAKL